MEESFSELLEQYETGRLSDDGLKRFFFLLEEANNQVLLAQAIDKRVKEEMHNTREKQTLTDAALRSLMEKVKSVQAVHSTPVRQVHFLRKWGWAAASIILVLGIGAYFLVGDKKNKPYTALTQQNGAVTPNKGGAVLTLADGSMIQLDSLSNGLVATQNGANVLLQDGKLSYNVLGSGNDEVVYNTVVTPNGKQFRLLLPDGTQVWLNAASSIRYPTMFNEKDRRVEVTGEVYMEVATDKSKPFVVATSEVEVQVLGTSFNINAYSDEPSIRTTLLEGSIKVLKKAQTASGIILKPGQQVVVDEKITISKDVDLEQIVSWKNGFFNFNGANLDEFMRQIARWYDLTIVYRGAIPIRTFNGKLGRDLQLSQILQLLKRSNIKYQLSGNTITIESQ